MTTLRERLLEALGDVLWDDLPQSVLVEVLLERLKRTKAEASAAQSALMKARLHAADIQRGVDEEIRQLRTNPLAAVHGDFYFLAPAEHDTTYVVSIAGCRNIRMYKRSSRSGMDYALVQITPEEVGDRDGRHRDAA